MLPQSVRHSPHAGNLLDFTNQAYGLSVVRCLAEFAMGLLSYRIVATKFSMALGRSRWLAPGVCFAIFALMTVPRTDLAIVLLFPPLILCLASGTNLPKRILSTSVAEFLGVLSYSIYLIHTLIEGVQYWALYHFVAHGIGHPHFWSDVVLGLVLLGTSVVAHRLIEVPCRRWLRNWFEPKRHVNVPSDGITTRSV